MKTPIESDRQRKQLGMSNGSNNSSARLRGVIRYPLCVLVSAVAWAVMFMTAFYFITHQYRTDLVLFPSWIYYQSGIHFNWIGIIFLMFLSAAVAVIAWHFRKASK